MPTLNCLVNLTETPFFVVDLDEVDHVHFERVTYMSKAFDMVLVNKDFAKQPWRIDMIPNGDKDAVQEWLTDMEITYTEGPMNLNWKQIMATVKDDDRFYMDTEEDEVTEKEAGWEFLRMFGKDDEDENDDEENDSEFDDAKESEEGSDEESEVEDLESEDDDEDDFEADDDLEEQGLDWDEMEAEAAMDDKRKRSRDDDIDEEPSRKSKQLQKRNSSSNGNKRSRR
jgi:nucleosome binding factor SPN SPT16 subunit